MSSIQELNQAAPYFWHPMNSSRERPTPYAWGHSTQRHQEGHSENQKEYQPDLDNKPPLESSQHDRRQPYPFPGQPQRGPSTPGRRPYTYPKPSPQQAAVLRQNMAAWMRARMYGNAGDVGGHPGSFGQQNGFGQPRGFEGQQGSFGRHMDGFGPQQPDGFGPQQPGGFGGAIDGFGQHPGGFGQTADFGRTCDFRPRSTGVAPPFPFFGQSASFEAPFPGPSSAPNPMTGFQQMAGPVPMSNIQPMSSCEAEGAFFIPSVDVFEARDTFHIHVSLPGAKKEDSTITWNPEKSELIISGAIHRSRGSDEDFLKALALAERKTGKFERKVRLGSRVDPAQVDDENMTAKMEDGVLTIVVPKVESEFVEVKKVDIE